MNLFYKYENMVYNTGVTATDAENYKTESIRSVDI